MLSRNFIQDEFQSEKSDDATVAEWDIKVEEVHLHLMSCVLHDKCT